MKQKMITEREISLFRNYLIKTEKSKSTIEKYVRDVRKLQRYANGKRLTRTIMLQYKKYLEDQKIYKVNSINSYLTAVNQFCSVMHWNELCVRTIKVQKMAFESEEKELTMQEYKRMVSVARDEGEEVTALLLQTIAATGIRVSELCHITVECLETGVADVYNKGKVRRILLPSELQKILQKYVYKQNIIHGPIFKNRKQNPMDRREVWRRMKRIAGAAGISERKVFPHNLRHLFARQFYQQTGDIAKLADVLGHSSIETTRIYIKSTGREHKLQLDQMNMVCTAGGAGSESEMTREWNRGLPAIEKWIKEIQKHRIEYILNDNIITDIYGGLCSNKLDSSLEQWRVMERFSGQKLIVPVGLWMSEMLWGCSRMPDNKKTLLFPNMW